LAVIIKLGILLSGTSVSDGSYLEDYVAGHGYSVRPIEDDTQQCPYTPESQRSLIRVVFITLQDLVFARCHERKVDNIQQMLTPLGNVLICSRAP
jgi:hypothetical protein